MIEYTIKKIEFADEELVTISTASPSDELITRFNSKILELINTMSKENWEPIFPLTTLPFIYFKKNRTIKRKK